MNPYIMALLLAAGWGIFAFSALRRWKLMRVGTAENRFDRPGDRLRLVVKYALAQLRMRRYRLAGIAHMLIFSGFVVLLLRSLILWGKGFDESFNFWVFAPHHPLGQVYSFVKDLFVVLVILGTLVFVYYRVIAKLPRMTLSVEGLVILGIILVMMFADLFYDGASLVLRSRASADARRVEQSPPAGEEGAQHETPTAASVPLLLSEPAGSVTARMVAGLSDRSLKVLKHVGFWTHSALVLLFLNLLPYSKHFHVITAIPNVYTQSLEPPGRLAPIEDLEGKVEREETLGIKRIDQFSWKAILDFYTCTECGRCSDYCPATNTGKKLSPKHFTMDLRDFLYQHDGALRAGANGKSEPRPSGSEAEPETPEHNKDLVPDVIHPEVLWACTTCRACEQECPVFISYVDKIVDMRRYLTMERGEVSTELQTAFRGLETNANPWNFPASDRMAWAEGLDVKTIAENPDAEVLFWIGCAGAFDERAKKVTQATVKLLKQAGVDFAVLGMDEQCTGDPARRAGNEYLYQMFAQQNVETLNNHGADKKKIITTCPHCFNTLRNEYPDFGGNYDVVHHSTFLAGLIRQGKLRPTRRVEKTVVYHDSCYLGRHNEVYDPPRDTLACIPGLKLVEPKETRDRGMCCGAGGAQMFKEEEPGTERVNDRRTAQLLETRPDTVSSACPFCMRMLTDGLANKNREDLPQLDIAEVLLESVEVEAAQPSGETT